MRSVKKLRAKNNQTSAKKIKHRNKSNVNDAEVADANKDAPKKPKKVTEDVRKMFVSSIDPFDAPLKWWESEHVKYAINYPPVKSKLEKMMGSHVVRLTDRNYMSQLAFNIVRDQEEEQKIRIEGRKLPPPLIISRLMEISYRALFEKIKRQERNKIKLPI